MFTQSFAELLLFVPVALSTGFVLFIAGVIQGVMESLDAATFRRVLTELVKRALSSPYAIVVSSITYVGMIPYWIYYGFGNRWFTAGLIMWVVTSSVSKIMTLPIYQRVTGVHIPKLKDIPSLSEDDVAGLNAERIKLHRANRVRAALYVVTVALMVAGLYG